ncbi:MAG: PAS domain S-box protein, partial [Elainellaceae cyanobacterium]
AYGDRAADLLRDVIRKKYALESRWDEGEFTIRVRDGSQRIWQFSSAPLGPLPDGRRVVTSMAADVTARRQAEIALRESEERYRSIYTQAAMGLANATLDGRLINVNPRFCEMVGYSYEELMSKTVEEITHPDDREKVRPEVERLFTGEKSYFFQEKRYIRRDGSCFWSATGVSVVCDAAGQPKHTLAVIRDISDRKQAEEHVHALLRRTQLLNRISSEIRDSLDLEIILQNLVNAVVAGVSVDACNFAWCLNDNPSDPSSSRLEIVKEKKTDGLKGCLGSYQYNDFPSLFDSILNNQLYRIDRLSEAPDEGLARNLECVGLLMFLCIPIHTSVGNIGSLQVGRSTDDQQWQDEEIELFQSIANQLAIAIYQAHLYQESQAKTTQLRQSYQELQDAQRHMVQAEKMSSLGQLVAGIAHEINNPVGFIYGNLSAASEYVSRLTTLIRQYQADYPAPSHELARTAKQLDIDYILKDFPKLLASMENGATRIQNIVKSLRTFSRLDQADHSAVAIHQHIENTLVILQNRLNGRAGNPEIHIIKQYGELPLVECYSSLMDQVFMNLLVNAVDAIEERQSSAAPAYSGCITITTSTAADDQVLISIRDNGIGMTSSTKAKIFNPFFTTKPIGIGTGMGLSISYQIVTGNHQGQLHCTSTPEEGTEFVIYLPLSLSQAPE